MIANLWNAFRALYNLINKKHAKRKYSQKIY